MQGKAGGTTQELKCSACSHVGAGNLNSLCEKTYLTFNCSSCTQKNFAISCPVCHSNVCSLTEADFYPGKKIRCKNSNCTSIFQYISCPLTTCRAVNCYMGEYNMGSTIECQECNTKFQDITCSGCGTENYFRGTTENNYKSGMETTCRTCKQQFIHVNCPNCQEAIFPKTSEYLVGDKIKCTQCKKSFQTTNCSDCKLPNYYKQADLKRGRRESCRNCNTVYKTTICPECSYSNKSSVLYPNRILSIQLIISEPTEEKVVPTTCGRCSKTYRHVACPACNSPLYPPLSMSNGPRSENCTNCKTAKIYLFTCGVCKLTHVSKTSAYTSCPLGCITASPSVSSAGLFSHNLPSQSDPMHRSPPRTDLFGQRQNNEPRGAGLFGSLLQHSQQSSRFAELASIDGYVPSNQRAANANSQKVGLFGPSKGKGSKQEESKTAVVEKPAEDSAKQCCVCLENEANTALIPCGHANFCGTCSSALMKTKRQCPLCKKPIQSQLRIYS